MAAVNFYRFAAAIMQLLEPENYNFSQNASSDANLVLPDTGKEQFIEQALQTNDLQTLSTETSEAVKSAEAKTVEAVAEHLTNAIANASDEKIVQVAKAIQEAAAETAQSTQTAGLTETIINNKSAETITEATELVTATINTIAAKTAAEVKSDETTIINTTEPETAGLMLETKATVAVTEAITDKIIEKTETLNNTAGENKVKDFWELFPELEPSEIKYTSAVSYLYEYMSNNELLGYLNPEIDLTERYSAITGFTKSANRKSEWEANNERVFRENTEALNDKLKEDEQETRDKENRKNSDLIEKQRLEQRKLQERIDAARLKELI